jgi:hypothetical protein
MWGCAKVAVAALDAVLPLPLPLALSLSLSQLHGWHDDSVPKLHSWLVEPSYVVLANQSGVVALELFDNSSTPLRFANFSTVDVRPPCRACPLLTCSTNH